MKLAYIHSICRAFFRACLSVAILMATTSLASAQDGRLRHQHCLHTHSCHRHTHAIFLRAKPASFVIDATTGRVLESQDADSTRYPASLTKMMTLYLTFDALKHGRLRLDQNILVSQYAAQQPQTNIALQPGDQIAVKDAILSIVVRSANDSAVTLAEALGGGSEAAFAHRMTEKARALGMNHTFFHNASGLPDPMQRTTARDMAILGRALRRDFPQYFPFFRTESFSYRGKLYVTHNHVMTRYDGVDGIKTGYIRASGFNVVTSVKRDGHSLIAVVMGGSTARARDDKMIALLDHTFTQLAVANGKPGVKLASFQRTKPTIQLAKRYSDKGEGEGDQQEEIAPTTTIGNAYFEPAAAPSLQKVTVTQPQHFLSVPDDSSQVR